MHPEREQWLLPQRIEKNALILVFGREGTFKSFIMLDWSLQIAATGLPVVYLHAEGRGLWKRLRAWCVHGGYDWLDALNGFPLWIREQPENLSNTDALADLIAAIEWYMHHGAQAPALIVIDTMTRNSDGTIERSNEDAVRYLNLIDRELRARYGCSVIFVHHVGHLEQQRARGPFALIANTDANFLIERLNPEQRIVTVRSGRMKDCEPPAPFELQAQLVEFPVQLEDGSCFSESSLVIVETGRAPPTDAARKPSGKAQLALLTELERLQRDSNDTPLVWSEPALREIARGLGQHRNTATAAVFGLLNLRYLTPTVSGSRLTHLPP